MGILATAAWADDPVSIIDEMTLPRGDAKSFAVTLPAPPSGQHAVLSLLARVEFDKVAGYNNALRVTINGKALTAAQLINKPARAKARSGDVYSMAGGEWFAVYYSPDFTSPDSDPHYGLTGDIRPCVFDLDITSLIKVGVNEFKLECASGSITNALVIADAKVEWRAANDAAPPRKPAPTGELARYAPRVNSATAFTMREPSVGELDIVVGNELFSVRSTFSTPDGKWTTGSNNFFDYKRVLKQTPEALIVRDTFTNKTDQPLGILQKHSCTLGASLKRGWLAGLEQPDLAGALEQSANPTTFATTEQHGIGFIPLSDAFHIHVRNAIDNGTASISDNSFVIGPKATQTAEWAIIPTDAPDYWIFLNAARRLVDANFTIEGGFAFLRGGPPLDTWTDQQVGDFIKYKDALYTCASIDYPRYEGRYTHGIAFQRVDHSMYIKTRDQRKRVVPESKYLVYFHCFIDVTDDGPTAYADSRLLMPDGKQADYGEPYDRIYFPTENNSFGKEIGTNVDIILDKIGADGVYWDEHEYSRYLYHYAEPWDGASGDINPDTHAVTRLKSSVTLLSESWRLAMAKKILARGPLIGNGPPLTRARAALKFPCFVETGSITNCTQAHLHSPIALGDHLTETTEEDAYGTMLAALDYGCVYHWYNDVTVVPTHHTLTQYMYPFTPVELHEGYVIGKERILTNRSGLFGWGDDAKREVHVFDEHGVETNKITVPTVVLDGKTYSEVRIAEGYSAAIVRK